MLRFLRDEGYAVITVRASRPCRSEGPVGAYDLVIVDAEPFGMSARKAAQVIRSVAPGMPVVIMGGEGGKDLAAWGRR